jgi:long-subunit fatty acid transport protein
MKQKITFASSCLVLSLVSNPVNAGGFLLIEQDAAGLGTAYAGMAATSALLQPITTPPR